MKRHSRLFTNIIVSLFIANLICFCGCSCFFELDWDWRGPYHHAAIISTPKKTVSVGEEIYSLINEKLYKHNDEQLDFVELNHYPYGNLNVSDLASDNQNLFIVAYGSIFSLKKDDLSQATINLGDDDLISINKDSIVETLVVEDKSIYYVAFKERVENKDKYEVCSYDLRTKAEEILYEFFNIQSTTHNVNSKIIAVDDKLLFMDERMNLFWVNTLGDKNRVVPKDIKVINDSNTIEKKFFESKFSFALEKEIAHLKIVEQGVRFQYKGEVYEYPIQANQLRLYPIVKVIEGKIYFAVNDWLQKEDCERLDCICRYNASMLIIFDLESKQFSLQKQIGERDSFVDFGKDEYVYYLKGVIYRNESALQEVQEIKPDVSYKIVEGSPRPAYELKLAYYDGGVNSFLQDNRAHLSREYA